MTEAKAKAKVATVWLDGCSGCHMSLLDIDEAILTVARKADIVYGPLVDAQEFPEGVDVTLVEGAVSSQDDLKLVQKIRKRTRLLLAFGDCAVTSNVPSMRNGIPTKRLLERIYLEGSEECKKAPTEGVPALLKHAIPVHEVVKVDLHIPGCPPKAGDIAFVLGELLEGRKPDLATKVKFG
jgi:NAD-reducing hydrogenase small subunit